MNGFELVAGVTGVFFAAGIVVGALIVLALPQVRCCLRARRQPGGAGWQEAAAADEDGGPPRWPGH